MVNCNDLKKDVHAICENRICAVFVYPMCYAYMLISLRYKPITLKRAIRF